MDKNKTPEHIRIDERNHVEKPLLDQLAGLEWEILDLDKTQTPQQTFRENFTEVVMLPVLREQLKVINPWLEDDQVEEVVKQLTASFPGTGLIQNNRHVFTTCCWKTPASARTARRARKARPCASSTSPSTGTTTALSRFASSRCASWAPSTISFRTSSSF